MTDMDRLDVPEDCPSCGHPWNMHRRLDGCMDRLDRTKSLKSSRCPCENKPSPSDD